jgi:AcrR family transcriptional regulator
VKQSAAESRRSNAGTRERILTAAMEVFASRGYHGTVVDDIVDASDTSKGAFYHYFPSKQGIFLTLMDELAVAVEQGVETVIASERGALPKVEAALRVVLETAAARRDLARILLIEAVGLGPTVEARRLQIHRRFAQVIRRHLDRAAADGDIPAQDTALAAQAWIGVLSEVISQWLPSNSGDLLRRLPALRALLLRSIGARSTTGGR